MVLRGVVWAALLAVFAAGMASAQTIDFTLLAIENGQAALIPNDYELPFLTTVGTQQTATVKATYTGTTQATITTLPQQVGSTEFTLTSTLALPAVLGPGQSFTLTITFKPTNSAEALGEISVTYTEPTGTGGSPVANVIQIGLEGESPSFVLSYILQSNQNVVQIPTGGTIPFAATQINTTAEAYLNITNLGSGPGTIIGISPPAAGSPFKVQDIPLTPYTLAAAGSSGSNLQLLVLYTPTAVETDTAQVVITYQGGATATVTLTGSGITSTFSYKYLVQGVSTTVMPGGTITFPGANVGSTSSLILTITNTGSANGTISSISTSGPFSLTNPITSAPTLTPQESFSVSLTFAPTQIGTQTGYLVVGNAPAFNLTGQGLGADLTFAYTSSAGTTAVNPATGGAVVFSPIEVGQSEQVIFVVTNSGSLPATISLVAPSPANGSYSLSAIALPKILAANQTLSFTITFTPTVTGISDGDLILDTTSIPLVGSGTAPPALPSYTIAGPSGNATSASQSNISLTLSKGYSLDLTGTLTLTTEGTFGTDPAVQFATGGRTVDFTIPANSTSANFAGQGSELPVQTGTVAETVTLTPTFSTAGGVNVTPSSPTTLQFTIPSAAPVLESAAIADESADSFALVLTGYSTTRSLTSLNVTFNPASGFNIGTSQLTIDLSQVSTAWFASAASVSFGGQFAITMPFTLTGTVKAGQALIDSIASVTATVSNSVGTSGSLQANVQ